MIFLAGMSTIPEPTAAQVTAAREIARWAGRLIPNGPAAGALMYGYHVGHSDLDLAIAYIVERARREAVADFITRNSVSHVARIKPGVMVAGSLTKHDEYAAFGNGLREPPRSKIFREHPAAREARQLAVRMTGKCDACGAEFASSEPAFAPGPAKRTRKQWREAFLSVPKGSGFNPRTLRERKRGPVSKTETPSGLVPTYSMGRLAAAKEKIPNHKGSPTGKHRGPSRGKRK